MALVVADRVKETTTTSGTGTYDLGGVVTGFQSFATAVGNTNTTYYACTDGNSYEIGIGTYASTGNTLARTTILKSTNSNAAVNWGTSTKEIFVTYPAEKSVFKDASGDITGLTVNNSHWSGTDLAVANGGTGASTLTDGGVLLGSGTGAITAMAVLGDGEMIVGDGTTDPVAESGATLRTSIGVAIGSDVQAYDADLTALGGLAKTDSNFIVGNGSTWVAETGSTARTSLGLAIGSDVQAYDAQLATLAGLTANQVGGLEDLATLEAPASDGQFIVATGSGAFQYESGATARTSLGLAIGSDVQAYDADLAALGGLAKTDSNFIVGNGSTWVAETGATVRTSLGLGTAAVLDTGISDTNIAKFTSGVADDDFLRVDGTAIEGRSASEVLSDIGGQASLTFGISNTNAVKVDSASVADDEYARFTANGLESRSTSEVLSDIGGQASLTFGKSDTNALKLEEAVAEHDILLAGSSNVKGRTYAELKSDLSLNNVENTALSTGTALNATNATHVSVADNESTDENNLITFIENASATGNVGLESDGDFHYNPSTGKLTATQLAGTLQTAAQANITSVGTLTGLTTSGDVSVTGDLTLTSTDAGAGDDPSLILYRNSSSPADSDDLGEIIFRGRNDNSQDVEYAKIWTEALDVSDGTEDAKFYIDVMVNGTLTNFMNITGSYIYYNRDIHLWTNRNLVFEGATADGNETTLTVTDPTQDNTVTLPDTTGTVLVQDSNDDVIITSTDAGATDDPSLILYRNSSSPADSDDLGEILFRGRNDNSQDVDYGKIWADAADVSDGTEDGKVKIDVMSNGTLTNAIDIKGNSKTFFNNLDVQLGVGRSLYFEGATSNANEVQLTVADPSQDNTITLPDATGTVALATPNILAGTLLVSTTISDDAYIDFSSTYITDDYDYYDLVVNDIIPATDATFLMCRFGFGGTVDSGNHYPYRVYNFGMKETDTWQSYSNAYGPSNAIVMSVSAGSLDMGNATAEHLNGVFRFYNFRSTSFFKSMIQQELQFVSSGGYHGTWYYMPANGYFNDHYDTKCDTLRVMAGSGNLTSGKMSLYGWKK